MHESIFSHTVDRPYPVRWLTPVTILGGAILTILITFLSISSSGYELITVETSKPNTTASDVILYSNWPSFLTANTRSTCTSKTIAVKSQVSTNNTAFVYNLERVWTDMAMNSPSFAGELTYHDNTLRNCTISQIQVAFSRIGRTGLQMAKQVWGGQLSCEIICSVETSYGIQMLAATTSYDLNSDSSGFEGRNQTTKASLWWGESGLAWYYIKTTRDMHVFANEWKEDFDAGYISFAIQNDSNAGTTAAVLDGCFFVKDTVVSFCVNNRTLDDNLEVWNSSRRLADFFYYSIMTDLGQHELPTPNILVNPALLQNFTKAFDEFNARTLGGNNLTKTWTYGDNMNHESFPDLANASFTTKQTSQWNLGVSPSTLALQYTCQIPKLKSSGSLIISVLVADLVLLRALWRLWKYAVDFFLVRKYPSLNACKCCEVSHGLVDITTEDNTHRTQSGGPSYVAIKQVACNVERS